MSEKKLQYRHNPGSSCACVAWSGVLNNLGYNFQESDIFGLGSGLNFGYAAIATSKSFDISLISSNIIDDLFINLGVYGKLFQYSDNYKCLRLVLELLDQNMPVALLFNPCYCHGLIKITPEEVRQHLPTHWIVVTGYNSENETLTIYDNRQFNPIVISFEEFIKGRNSNTGKFDQNPRNFFYHICLFDKINPLEIATKFALQKICVNFLDIEKELSFYVGSYGYEKCIRQIRSWNAILSENQLIELLKKIQLSITGAGGVKGGYRRLFSRFLTHASETLNMNVLLIAASLFSESASLWDCFVNKLIDYQKDPLAYYWGDDSELSQILHNIYIIELEAISKIDKIV